MASWIYSLARYRATNQDESKQDYPNQVQGTQDQHSQELRAENQELRARMGTTETQMVEMKGILLALRNEGTNKSAIAAAAKANPESIPAVATELAAELSLKSEDASEGAITTTAKANSENAPSVTTESVQITFAESNEGTGVHHAQVPDPVSMTEISLSSSSPATINPQIQVSTSGDTTHSRDPHVNPALVSVTHSHYGVNGCSQDHLAAAPQARNKYQLLKERLRIIERSLEARDPSPVPNVLLSPMFKVPDFVKFEGMTCPVAHAARYCELILPLTEDYKLMTYCFRANLGGEALSWYIQEHAHTSCWGTLVNAFLERFNYNIGKAPNRAQLQNMAQRNKETFREYVWRWRHLAAQVTPSLPEEEKVDIFMNTLPPLYYDQLIGNAPLNFKDLILAGENLESGVRNGKTAYDPTEATPIVGSGNVSYSPEVLPQVPHSSTQARKSQQTQNYVRRKPEDFNPIPMSYSDLLDHLVSHELISIRSMKPVQPPFPKSYDPAAACKFHGGGVGHSVENCKALKHAVQDLIDSKYLKFDANGLPVKEGGEISTAAIKGKAPQCNPIPVSYTDVCRFLTRHDLISPRRMKPVQPPFPSGHDPKATCEFHAGAIGHSTENCYPLK